MNTYKSPELIKPLNTGFNTHSDQLKLPAENLVDGLIIINNQLNFQYVSPAYFEQLGYVEPEFSFRSLHDLVGIIHPEDVDIIPVALKSAFSQNQKTVLVSYRVKNKAGDYIALTGTMYMVVDRQGECCCAMVGFQNRLADSQLKQAAGDAEINLQKLSASLPGVLYQLRMTPDGKASLPYASEGLVQFLDCRFEEVKSDASALFNKVLPEDKTECIESIMYSFQHLTNWKQEFRIRFDNGSTRWIGASASPVKEYDGSVTWHGFLMDITEGKEAELLNRQKDEQLKTIAASLPGILYQFRMQPDGQFSMPYASEGLKSVYGISWDDVKNDASKIFTTIHPEDIGGMIQSITDSYTHLTNWQHKFRVVFEDGRVQTISGSSVPQKEADGSVLWNGFLMDITERKKIENEARQKNEQLNRIASQVPGAILQFRLKPDLSISIPFANKGFETIFGLKADEVKQDATPFLNLLLPEAKKTVKENMFASMNTLTPWVEMYQMRLPDGAVHLMSGNAVPELEADGSVLWTGFITDVTRQKEAEDKIRESDARFKYMFEDHNAVMLLIEPETGNIENANQAASHYYGYSHQQLCSMNIGEINLTDSRELYRLRQLTLTAANAPLIFKHRLSGGEDRFVEVRSSPVDYGDRRVLYAIVHDVTEKKEAEEQLKRQSVELKTSNQDLENFAHLASHDLKEPLRMVTSFLGLIEKRIGAKLDEKDKQYFHFAIDGANRMKVLISDLLHYSRIGSNKEDFSLVDFKEVVEYNMGILAESITEKQAVVLVHPLPVIAANNTLINELYLNLLNNALKYSSADLPTIVVGYETGEEEYRFYVKDNGIGINPEYHEKIFQMFQRLHSRNEYSGTGIGLALCKRIANTHHGKIWVDSEVGKGSTFWFSIPKTL